MRKILGLERVVGVVPNIRSKAPELREPAEH